MKKRTEEFFHMILIWFYVGVLLVVIWLLQGCTTAEKIQPRLYAGSPSEGAIIRRIPSRNINEGVSCKDPLFREYVAMPYEDYIVLKNAANKAVDFSLDKLIELAPGP